MNRDGIGTGLRTFDELADQDWRIMVDEYDLNEVTICYPDPDRRGCFVGPLAKVYVGETEQDDDGDEVLCLESDDGRNLYAVAMLPQLAGLCRWIDENIDKLGVSESDEYNQFVDSLKDRVAWIRECIDDREMQIGASSGSVGFSLVSRPEDQS